MASVKETVTARGKTTGKASPTPSTSTIDSRPGSSAKVHAAVPTSVGGLHVGSNAKDKGKEALPGAIDTGNDPTNPHELIGWVSSFALFTFGEHSNMPPVGREDTGQARGKLR